jgi:hypothetical protein
MYTIEQNGPCAVDSIPLKLQTYGSFVAEKVYKSPNRAILINQQPTCILRFGQRPGAWFDGEEVVCEAREANIEVAKRSDEPWQVDTCP